MKITKKHMACAWALLIMGLTSCSDDLSESTNVKAGDAISFSAGSVDTRTIYDDENIFKINWEQNDLIKIYSNKNVNGGISSADYVVSPIKTTVKDSIFYNTGTMTAADINKQLTWVDWNPHKFIAVYPHNAAISVDTETGNVKLPLDRNQVVQEVVKVSDSPYYSKKYGKYTYYAKPDMTSAYMIAHKTVSPGQSAETGGKVELNFKPIMTTLEIIVKGVEQGNNKDIHVTGVSVIRDIPSRTGEHNTSFLWNEYNNALGYDQTDVNNPPTKITRETTFVSFKQDQEVTLKGGESLVMTVFMPPLVMNKKLPITVRVHATGATAVETKLIPNPADAADNTVINGGEKRRITTPPFPMSLNGNNWMTNLDDNVYVSQLSIPGTHDSGTGEGMYDTQSDQDRIGQTQSLKIDEQLNIGIRAFDLRPANYSGTDGNNIWLYHGILCTRIKWEGTNTKHNVEGVIEKFKKYLEANPGEFIIALIRHENELVVPHGLFEDWNDSETWATSMKASLDRIAGYTNKTTGQPLTVNFKPDLTVGECRGKILFLCRSWNKPGYGQECPYTKPDANGVYTPTVGGYIGWNHSQAGAEVDIWGPGANSTGKLYIQDCYAKDQEGVGNNFQTAKTDAINHYLELTRKFHTDSKMINHWSISHTSGYNANISTTTAYRHNAEQQNVPFYNKLLDPTWEGSTGIIMSDWVGDDVSADIKVMGARMPQIIIDNNYKYRMKRKPVQ